MIINLYFFKKQHFVLLLLNFLLLLIKIPFEILFQWKIVMMSHSNMKTTSAISLRSTFIISQQMKISNGFSLIFKTKTPYFLAILMNYMSDITTNMKKI